ncbi:MAG: cation:proton antiporter [Alphaproteobacteria bacterium]|nr:cation:proton antiporter [Alphaproteobacteria bacterium]
MLVVADPALAAGDAKSGDPVAIFIGQILLLLLVGRVMGELALRVGQPAVMGQLIAGIMLGPSLFGAVLPELRQIVFPDGREQKSMIDAVSQLGVLMLLLVTGMETDLSLVRKVRRAAFAVSLTGIVAPFLCGMLLGEWLPESLLPDANKRLITALFLGVALSISSVKIVAMVVREMHFTRRNVGQVMLAAAIIDDTIGWIIMAMVFGLAQHGTFDLAVLGQSVLGTLIFLAAAFTIGRRMVSFLIRWANDVFISEVPVITMILIVMCAAALMTNAIGVHTVLGAFVAGIVVGQSPILTRHIDEQLRGLITALFMPIFFGLAGLSADLSILANPTLLTLGIGLVLIASVGKFLGAFIGGALGGMSARESLALGCGMNARGSTEVIVATIGLSMGVLSRDLFSLIVAMAVITTMAMPPMLRWALSRLPMRPEESARLEREAMEARGFVPRVERVLVAADDSANGKMVSRLAGLFSIARRAPMTIVEVGPPDSAAGDDPLKTSMATIARRTVEEVEAPAGETVAPAQADVTTRKAKTETELAVAAEAKKGYGLLMVGLHDGEEGTATDQIGEAFGGPVAIVEARGPHAEDQNYPLNILVPINGTPYAERAGELALVFAQVNRSPITALYVADTTPARRVRWNALARQRNEDATLGRFMDLAEHYGVDVHVAVLSGMDPANAILRQLRRGDHNLVVLGVSPRTGSGRSFGRVATTLDERCDRTMVFLAS